MMANIQRLVPTILQSSSMTRQQLFHKVLPWLQHLDRRGYSASQKNLPVIYMFTKDNCSLCDDAKSILQPYRHRFQLKEVDITKPENQDWFDKYQYDIPVFHMADDFLFKHKVDLTVLENVLKDYESKS